VCRELSEAARLDADGGYALHAFLGASDEEFRICGYRRARR
jgi:hypothetical protein